MVCSKCGKEIEEKYNFCVNCGHKKEDVKFKNSIFGLFITIMGNFLVILCLLIGFILLFKFDYPEIISEEYFEKYMKNKGCNVVKMKHLESYIGANRYLITDEDACPYLISYVIINDKDKKNEFFNQVLNEVRQNTNVTGGSNISIKSKYYEYSTNGDFYKIVVLNKNSILYATSSKEDRMNTIEIFKDLGYKYKLNWFGFKILWIAFLINLFLYVISMWRIEKKIRNKGFIALIPFYNIWCLSKDILGKGYYAFLLLLPIGNIAFLCMLSYKLGKIFDRRMEYCILLIMLPSIFWPLLAFDDSKYNRSVYI